MRRNVIHGILCYRRIPAKLRGKVYKTVTRPAIQYGAETGTMTKEQDKRDATMDVRSDTQRQDQERTHPMNNESIGENSVA